jgi:hypothetical protein
VPESGGSIAAETGGLLGALAVVPDDACGEYEGRAFWLGGR